MKQKSSLVISLLFLCGFLFAQNNTESADKPGTWILDKSVSQVDFYHMIKECNGKNVVFLKFNNKNTYPVKVSWSEVFATQMGTGKIGVEGRKSLVIKQGESSYSDCTGNDHKELITLATEVSPTYVAEISKFGFQSITVEKVK